MIHALAGKARGCDHVVLPGYGEPALWPHLVDFIKECAAIGMTVSFITNGLCPVKRYEAFYAAGLNHILLSVHGVGNTEDAIVRMDGAAKKQAALLKWLKENNMAWRSDTTIQLLNYERLPEITEYIIEHGAFHVVLLGFLPHYEWLDGVKMKEVAAHPAGVRLYAERAIRLCETAGRWVTLRYHPMCHIAPEYYKYVTNTNFVLLDCGEWDYGHAGDSDEALLKACRDYGESIGVLGEPCSRCSMRVHCGGWNRFYVNGLGGSGAAGLKAIEGAPQEWAFYWNKNPYNRNFNGHNQGPLC
jgi:MoaA/NifB/PqqE/SkfB family radical SAM enzyme